MSLALALMKYNLTASQQKKGIICTTLFPVPVGLDAADRATFSPSSRGTGHWTALLEPPQLRDWTACCSAAPSHQSCDWTLDSLTLTPPPPLGPFKQPFSWTTEVSPFPHHPYPASFGFKRSLTKMCPPPRSCCGTGQAVVELYPHPQQLLG